MFLANYGSHKIVADKTYCAYYFSLQVGNRLRAQVSATMSIPPLHKTAFDREATQRWALNAIATQTSAELPTRRSNDRYVANRRVTVEDARAPQRSRCMIREGDDQMNTQTSNKAGLANNFWVQMAALVIVTVVIIALAAKYIW
jgi:nucleoside recognition membrane protein YjiH